MRQCQNNIHEKLGPGICRPCRALARVRQAEAGIRLKRRAHILLTEALAEIFRLLDVTQKPAKNVRIAAILKGVVDQVWTLQAEDHQVKKVRALGLADLAFEPTKSKQVRSTSVVQPLWRDGGTTHEQN